MKHVKGVYFSVGKGVKKKLEDVNITYDPPDGKLSLSARLFGYSGLNRSFI